jgi:hypothetical protein
MGTVFDTGSLDDIAYFDAFRTSDFTTLAVETHFKSFLVKIFRIFYTVALSVRSRVLRPRIKRRNCSDWAICRTDSALKALL